MLKTDSITETLTVHHLSAQEANCVMSEKISDITETHTMQCLSALEASCDSVKEFKYAEPQQHSIKNSSADTAAMIVSDSHVLISL